MEIDFNNITPLDLRILNHLRKNSITTKWEPLYEYITDNFGIDSEEAQKIILIYSYEGNDDIDFKNVNDISIPEFDYSSYSKERLAFSDYIGVHPAFIQPPPSSLVWDLTPFRLLIPQISHNTRYTYYIGTTDGVYRQAEKSIREKLNEEGWDFFSQSFLVDYVTINQRNLDYNTKEMALEEYNSYAGSEDGKIELLEKIDLYDDYDYLKETFNELTESKKEMEKSFVGLENVIQKLEKEKKIIEVEIERLVDINDYGDDDDDNYSTEFEDEIEDLENKLNKVENRLEEVEYEYNSYDKDYDTILDELEDITEQLSKYSGDSFKEFYVTTRKKMLSDEYLYDVYSYLDDINMTIGEAINDNILYIENEDVLIDEAIAKDGPEYFIGDLTIDSFVYDNEDYNILW